jgi:G:T-mismatch repair DNA endonuclease (very short patch repair protein)
MERDSRVVRRLRASGWSVVRVWEHDLKGPSGRFLSRLRRALDRKGFGLNCL